MLKERILAVFLSICIFVALLTGCDDSLPTETHAAEPGESINSEYPDKMEISIALWGIDHALEWKENDQFYTHLKNKFNIEILPISLNWDDYAQRILLWASSGDLPDIFSIDAVGTSYYRDWIRQGLIRPLPEDLSKYSNLDRYIKKADIEYPKENGRLYFVPRRLFDTLEYCVHDRNIFYRWDLAQEAGIEKEPGTWEEFGQMLQAIIRKDPEQRNVQGMTLVNIKHISGLFWLYSNPAAVSDGSGNDYKWVMEKGRYIPAVFSEKSLPSLINLRNMYTWGLLDRDAISNKGTQGYEKFATGKASAILMKGYGNLDTIVLEKWKQAYPGKKLSDCIKRARNFPATDGKTYQCVFKTFWSESYFSSEVRDEKFERILYLYDYLLSDDVKEFYRFGIKGVDYIKDGQTIVPLISQEELSRKQYSAPVLGSLVEYDDQFQYDPNNFTLDSSIREMAAKDIVIDMKTTILPEYKKELTYLSTPLKDTFTIYDYQDMVKVMLSEEPVESIWNKIIKEYEAKGLNEMIEEVNERAPRPYGP